MGLPMNYGDTVWAVGKDDSASGRYEVFEARVVEVDSKRGMVTLCLPPGGELLTIEQEKVLLHAGRRRAGAIPRQGLRRRAEGFVTDAQRCDGSGRAAA